LAPLAEEAGLALQLTANKGTSLMNSLLHETARIHESDREKDIVRMPNSGILPSFGIRISFVDFEFEIELNSEFSKSFVK
jgi:hypothetical protein